MIGFDLEMKVYFTPIAQALYNVHKESIYNKDSKIVSAAQKQK